MFAKLKELNKKKDELLSSAAVQKAGELANRLKEGASDTAKSVLKRGLEDRDLLKEAQRIHRECDRLVNTHNSRMSMLKNQFEQEMDCYNRTCTRVDEDILPLCQQFFSLSANALQANYNPSMLDLGRYGLAYMDNVYVDGTVDKKMVAAGLGVGAASAAGVFSAMAAFGTASTGTAIAALHGGAVYTATLAALGGGSVAAGGLGMTGGMIVLGATGAFPAIAAVGYLADKKIRRVYDEALKRKKDTDTVMAEADRVYYDISDVMLNIRAMNTEFRSFADFFADLMNMSIGAVSMGQEKRFSFILEKALTAYAGFRGIVIVRDDVINSLLADDVRLSRVLSDDVRSAFYGFYSDLTDEQQKLMDRCRSEQVRADKFRRKYNSAMEQALKVKAENKKLAEQHRQDQIAINQLRSMVETQRNQLEVVRRYADEQGLDIEDSRIWQEIDSIVSPITEDIINRNDSELQALQRYYRQRFVNFSEDVISSLAASDYLYGMLCRQSDMDFSPVLLPAFKAVEAIMREVLKNHGISRPEKGWLLGAMCHEVAKNPHIWHKNFCDTLEDVRQVRNKTAHSGGIQLFEVENMRIILLEDSADKRSLLTYLNEILM